MDGERVDALSEIVPQKMRYAFTLGRVFSYAHVADITAMPARIQPAIGNAMRPFNPPGGVEMARRPRLRPWQMH